MLEVKMITKSSLSELEYENIKKVTKFCGVELS